jgi:hypothetical protein
VNLATLERRLLHAEQAINRIDTPAPSWSDPVALAVAAGLDPDAWQRDFLTARPHRGLLNCSRQSGKSTTSAALAVFTALTEPGALVLLLSPTLKQSGELFRKCLALWRALGRPIGAASETALTLELMSGSRIVSLPGVEGSIRGYSAPRLVLADEAARVPNDIFASVLPMLAVSDGDFIGLSTPFGRRGWWADAYLSGSDDWQRWEIPATACPRISPSFLAEAERTIGSWWYDQEFLCRFLDAESSVFSSEEVEAAFTEEVVVWPL